MAKEQEAGLSRRGFVQGAAAGVALAAAPVWVRAAADADKAAVLAQIAGMHAANVRRLQEWIALPSIAAENRNYPQGPEYMAKLARDAGFTGVEIIPTSGKPGVFGRIDAGAPTTMGIYFMYDVKQFVPEEWSSPPLEGRLVQKEGLGTVCMGRGAVNQKGPENSFLSALMAFKAAGKKLPVNLVLVCEGEEEIGSPHFHEVVHTPKVLAELKKCSGVFMPEAGQERDGGVQVALGAKGVVELELISSGEKWGRGPAARRALEPRGAGRLSRLAPGAGAEHAGGEGRPHPRGRGILREGQAADARRSWQMIKARADRNTEAQIKEALGVKHWVHDTNWYDSLVLLESQADDQHRGTGGRLHRSGRQDGAAAPRGGEDRHAPGAGHDRHRHAGEAQGASGEARLRATSKST